MPRYPCLLASLPTKHMKAALLVSEKTLLFFKGYWSVLSLTFPQDSLAVIQPNCALTHAILRFLFHGPLGRPRDGRRIARGKKSESDFSTFAKNSGRQNIFYSLGIFEHAFVFFRLPSCQMSLERFRYKWEKDKRRDSNGKSERIALKWETGISHFPLIHTWHSQKTMHSRSNRSYLSRMRICFALIIFFVQKAMREKRKIEDKNLRGKHD